MLGRSQTLACRSPPHLHSRSPLRLSLSGCVASFFFPFFRKAFDKNCRLPVAFGSLPNVNDPRGQPNDRMESFFLAETLKYLYLIQDPDHKVSLAAVHLLGAVGPSIWLLFCFGGRERAESEHPADRFSVLPCSRFVSCSFFSPSEWLFSSAPTLDVIVGYRYE